MKFIILISLIFGGSTSFSPAFAEDIKNWRLSMGLGLGLKNNLRRDNTHKGDKKNILLKPLPLIQANWGKISLGHQGLSFMAFGNHFMNVSAFINRNGERYDGAGMESRKESFFAGISGKFLNYGLSFSKDITHHSRGHSAKLVYAKMFILDEQTTLLGTLGIEWFDSYFSNYYYGVNPTEATATRSTYKPGYFFRPTIGAMQIIKTSEKISLLTALNLKFFPKKIRQSPTMNGKSFEYSGIVGLSYRF